METQRSRAEKVRVSIVIAVLESYVVLRWQLAHFENIIRELNAADSVEVIIVDDGSNPPNSPNRCYDYKLLLVYSNDQRPWSQPCARNLGAAYALGDYLLMTDIDHIISKEALASVLAFTGDKMMFPRQWGVLLHGGEVTQDIDLLVNYGLCPRAIEKNRLRAGMHANTFAIRKIIYNALRGYDESFCGKYGGDDTDFANRYSKLVASQMCAPHVKGPAIYVYPDPKRDVKGMFHTLRKKR